MCNPLLIINALERDLKLEILSEFHWTTHLDLKTARLMLNNVIKIHSFVGFLKCIFNTFVRIFFIGY